MQYYRCVKYNFPRTRTIRDCDTVTFSQTSVPFAYIKLEDHLNQTASDILTILTQRPSTTITSLQAGDLVCNALLILATQLKRMRPILVIETIEPPPRVSIPIIAQYQTPIAKSQRVQIYVPVPASAL